MSKQKHWGFDTKDMDTKVRPQDDFFRAMTGNWMKSNEIPADEAAWGSFNILQKETQVRLHGIVEELNKKKLAVAGTIEQQIRDLYRSGMDMKLRNKLGAKPLQPYLDKIAKIETREELIALIIEFHAMGIGLPWGAGVGQDDKNSDANIIHMGQGGLGMPDRDYYLLDKPEQVRVRLAYQTHLERMFALIGESPASCALKAVSVLNLETLMAKVSMVRQDVRNPDKVYHKISVAALKKLAPSIPWSDYFDAIGADGLRSLNLMQPGFIKGINRLIEKAPLEDWKTYLTWHITSDAAAYLSEEFVQANFDFYAKVLAGSKEMKPLWRRTLAVVNGSLSEALGKMYVDTYFPPAAKHEMDKLITNLFAAFRVRLLALDWMGAATKKRAVHKLDKMVRKIGYPNKWKSYKGLEIKPDDYFGNILRSSRYEQRRNMKKLKKPVDRSEWHMPPQLVNAYYNPGSNEIVFPAAILQPPYFGPDQDASLNYGAIGAIIGHEMTHAFDNDGSKYDAKGNLRKWWTPEDRRRFEKRAKVLKEQFDKYELHGVRVNGKLTLGENIADLGGYAVAFDAYKRSLAKSKSEVIEGFTPEQRFFIGMAQDWKEIVRPELEKTKMLTDEHSPHELRVNGPASNLPEFYAAWSVKKGDKLYRDPAKRAKIW